MSPRSVAVALGLENVGPARTLYRTIASAQYFARGYRFGERISSSDTSDGALAHTGNQLEAYFDAHLEGPGIVKWRHYLSIYDRHLSRFRAQPVRLLEIGVAGGGSLQMWHDYLGPDAYVYGVDIDPSCKQFACEGTEVLIGDQGDPAFWERFLASSPDVDVVIDDGGHDPRQQAVTLESLLPHMRPGGVYICEDVHGPFQLFHSFVDGLTRPLNDIGDLSCGRDAPTSLHGQVASVHRYPILTVIEKPVCGATYESQFRGTQWPPGAGPS